jgi:hypothetical protein
MIIVGSKALKYYFPNIQREIKDVDVIGTQSDINYLCNALQPEKVRNTEHITTLINIQNKFGIWNTNNVEILNADASQSLRRYIDYDTKVKSFSTMISNLIHLI